MMMRALSLTFQGLYTRTCELPNTSSFRKEPKIPKNLSHTYVASIPDWQEESSIAFTNSAKNLLTEHKPTCSFFKCQNKSKLDVF